MPTTQRHVATDTQIGLRVRRMRRARDLTQEDLASQIPMSPTSLNRLEKGHQSVTAECLGRLAQALGVRADYLLGLQEEPTHP